MKKVLHIFLGCLFFSCGFYSFTGASISPEVKTYSVAFFENKANTINSSLSSQLNIQQIETEGDLSFSGEIVNYEIKPIAISSNETARQNRLTIKVKVSFMNIFDEKMNFDSNFVRYKDFPSDEDLSVVEDIYMQEICDELVEDIFNQSVVNW